jgi:hypothetical protein
MVSMSDELKEPNILKLILIVRFACAILDVGHPIARFEFESFWQDIDQMETVRIPSYGEHHVLGLNSMPLSFRNLCIWLHPNEPMVCVQVKP